MSNGEVTTARAPSTPTVGAARGAVVGVIATAASTAVFTSAPEPYNEVAAVVTGAMATGLLSGLGKWARDKGGLWGALLGWLI